jgi:hypothetical protein
MGTKHPNPAVPEMAAVAQSRALATELGLNGTVVFFNDTWVDYDERQSYLLEADAGVSTHFDHVETTYSFRTRILDYLWAGLPIITTGGDSFGDLVEKHRLGAVVAERDVEQLANALERVLYDTDEYELIRSRVREAREQFHWAKALAPLVAFGISPVHAADRSPRESNAPTAKTQRRTQRRPQRTGLLKDIDRATYYLKHGGVGAVLERYQARRKRRRESA